VFIKLSLGLSDGFFFLQKIMLDEHKKFTFFHFLHNSRGRLLSMADKQKLNDAACSKFEWSQLTDVS
jgi:hypothetical protein